MKKPQAKLINNKTLLNEWWEYSTKHGFAFWIPTNSNYVTILIHNVYGERWQYMPSTGKLMKTSDAGKNFIVGNYKTFEEVINSLTE